MSESQSENQNESESHSQIESESESERNKVHFSNIVFIFISQQLIFYTMHTYFFLHSTDGPKIRQADVCFALAIIMNSLSPSTHKSHNTGPSAPKFQHLNITGLSRIDNLDGRQQASKKTRTQKDGVRNIAFLGECWGGCVLVDDTTVHFFIFFTLMSIKVYIFLGLQILIICFEKQLSCEWYKISKCIQDLGNKLLGMEYTKCMFSIDLVLPFTHVYIECLKFL